MDGLLVSIVCWCDIFVAPCRKHKEAEIIESGGGDNININASGRCACSQTHSSQIV